MGCIKQYHELSRSVCTHTQQKAPEQLIVQTNRVENPLVWEKTCKNKNVTKDYHTECHMKHIQPQKCYSPVLTCHLFSWWFYWHLHNHFDLTYIWATAEKINYSFPTPHSSCSNWTKRGNCLLWTILQEVGWEGQKEKKMRNHAIFSSMISNTLLNASWRHSSRSIPSS